MRPWPHAQFLEEVKTMAYIISDDCISCGACEAECPVGAISEGDGKYQIAVSYTHLTLPTICSV